MIFIVGAVVAQGLQLLGKLLVVGHRSAGIAQRAQVLAGVEAEACGIAERADDLALVGSAVRLRAVFDDVKTVLSYLCESVSERVIRYGVGKARTVTISIRDERLSWITRQAKLPYPSVLSSDFFKTAIE